MRKYVRNTPIPLTCTREKKTNIFFVRINLDIEMHFVFDFEQQSCNLYHITNVQTFKKIIVTKCE